MRQLNIISPTTEALPNLGLLTNVVELTYYDMIYIYHRLKHKSRITSLTKMLWKYILKGLN
jgi:hypothetical protein